MIDGLFIFAVDAVPRFYAVPPPDLLFNIGAQVAQVFSAVLLFLSAMVAIFARTFRVYYYRIRKRRIFWLGLVVAVIGISLAASYFYSKYKQGAEYEQWVIESGNFAEGGVKAEEFELFEENVQQEEAQTVIDKDGEVEAVQEGEKEPTTAMNQEVEVVDEGEEFIKKYYGYLASGKIEEAYSVWKKSVPLEVYKEWYANTNDISLQKIRKIDDATYAFGVVVNENQLQSSYAVLMRLGKRDGEYYVDFSDSRAVGDAAQQDKQIENFVEFEQSEKRPDELAADKNVQSEINQQEVEISNEDFAEVLKENPFVLDARENEEYEIGRFSGSTHIRFADLLAGEWVALPTDRVVYVFCWSGIRGEEVANFLRSKNIRARYIKNGADGWVSYGGAWEGEIKFSKAYPQERFQKTFTTEEVRSLLQEGVVIVDSRPPQAFEKNGIAGSVNIPVIYTTSAEMEEKLSQVAADARVITVCDDFVSCFDAKITGLKLENRGVTFLGRYNKPWEW